MRGLPALLLGLSVALAGLCLCQTPAWGQRATDDALNLAKEHFDKGQSLYLRQQYDEAALEFLAAYEKKPLAALLFNVAVCYEKSSNYTRAIEYFRRFLSADPQSKDRAAIEQRITLLQRATPGRAPALPTLATRGLVVIDSNPQGATVYIGSRAEGPAGATPFSVSLDPGRYKVIVEAKGYKPEERDISPSSDKMIEMFFSLSQGQFLGWLEVVGNVPGADVFLDRKQAGSFGRTPYAANINPGKHVVFVERTGFQPFQQEVEIEAGKTHTIRFQMETVPYGWVEFVGRSAKGARVKINGKQACVAPCRVQVDPGKLQIEVERDKFRKYRDEIEVDRASDIKIALHLQPRPRRVSGFVTGGLSLAFLTGAIVCAVKAKGIADDIQGDIDAGKRVGTNDSRSRTGKIWAITADSLFGVAGLTAGLAVYYFLRREGLDSSGEVNKRDLSITPAVGAGSFGLSGQFRF